MSKKDTKKSSKPNQEKPEQNPNEQAAVVHIDQHSKRHRIILVFSLVLLFVATVAGSVYLTQRDKDLSEQTQETEESTYKQAVQEAQKKQNEGDADGAVEVWREYNSNNANSEYAGQARVQEATIYINSNQLDKVWEIYKDVSDDQLQNGESSILATYYEITGDFKNAAKYYYLTADNLEANLEKSLEHSPESQAALEYDIQYFRDKAKAFEDASQ